MSSLEKTIFFNGNEYLVLEMDRDKINGQLIVPKGLPDKFTLD